MKYFLSFCLGLTVSAGVCAVILHRTEVYIQQAKVKEEGQRFSVIQFYHDATDQVIMVKVPVEVFPNKVGGAYIRKVTVDVWSADDAEATRLMSDTALNMLINR